MSWLRPLVSTDGEVNPALPGETQQRYHEQIPDARGKLVSDKKANQPYLQYQKYKVAEEERLAARAAKIKRRDEKIANGEPLLPEDEVPADLPAWLGLLKLFTIIAGIVMFSGWFVTGSPFWQFEGKLFDTEKYFGKRSLLLHELELTLYDGRDPSKPLYLAIDGDVFDVSAGRANYGPGGPYHNFVGADSARAFATACTKGHRTHDLRGLTEAQIAAKENWKQFFKTSPKYPRVGWVFHAPIDPSKPLPGPCGVEEGSKPEVPHQTTQGAAAPVPVGRPTDKAHEEL